MQEIKPQVKEDEKAVKLGNKEEIVNVESEKAKIIAVDEAESHKPVVTTKERNIDLQLDLEKTDRDSGTASISGSNKLNHHVQKQQSQHTHNEKIGNFNFFMIWVAILLEQPFSPIGFLILWFLMSQLKRALYLCQCLFPAGRVVFLPWGTIGLICYVFLALSVISSISVLLIIFSGEMTLFSSADIWHLYKELFPWMGAPYLRQLYRYVIFPAMLLVQSEP